MGAKYDRPFITHVNDSNGVWGKKVNKAENVTLNHKYLKIEEDILDTWNVFSLVTLRFVNTIESRLKHAGIDKFGHF